MSVSAVTAGASHVVQAQAQSRPVAQVNVPKGDVDQVQISPAAKQLQAKAAHGDRDHDGD